MQALSAKALRELCPVKWHDRIPDTGISLGVADVDFHGPAGINEFLCDNLKPEFSFYQAQRGLDNAIAAASNYLRNKEISVLEDQIQITEGTMMAISITMTWIGQKPGDLLTIGPIYEPIHRHASRAGNTIHWSSLSHQGFDEEHVMSLVEQEDIKLITICNPSNPNGHVYTLPELKFLRDLAVDNNLYVFSDELYEPLWFDTKHHSIAALDGMENRSVLLYGFSKAYGLAGYRSGFMYLGPEIDDLRYLATQEMVSPSPVASLVCQFALEDSRASSWVRDLADHVNATTKMAAEEFMNRGLTCHVPDGCFFVFPNIGVDDINFTQYLFDTQGVQVVPGSAFGPMGKNHLRINCATSMERLKEGIDRIENALVDFEKGKI